jgi:CP family cyanate transporter-like MFS transporter
MNTKANPSKHALVKFAGLLALVFIAIILRPPVAAVGPLLGQIDELLTLGPTWLSVLASAPVFCFGLGAFVGPALVRRFGLHRAMNLILVLLAAAVILRVFGGAIPLMAGTFAIGLAIAVGNVLLPTVVRTDYPERIPLVTGVYTTLLALSASFAASTAVPWSAALGDWRWALLVWGGPAVAAVLLWSTQLKRSEASEDNKDDVTEDATRFAAEQKAVRRSPITWYLVAFFGLQSLGFYAILGWLPTALTVAGLGEAEAGSILGLTTAVGIPFGLILSTVMGRFKSLALPSAIASLFAAVGFALLAADLAQPTADLAARASIAGVLIGMGQASTFPLSLALIGSMASTKNQTTMLSALSQGWGYLLAGLGTLLVGMVAAQTTSYALPMAGLAALSAVQVWVAYRAGRPGRIPAA